MLQRHIEEMTAAVKSTTSLHRKLVDRLSRLPGEIAAGLNPDALAAEIVARVREQFLASGIPSAGRLLKEQGDDFRKMVAEQSRTIAALQQKLDDSGSSAERASDRLFKMSDTAENSLKKWNHNMHELHWAQMGLTLVIGILLGALLMWSAFRPPRTIPAGEKAQQIQPTDQPSSGSRRHEPNDPPRNKER